MIRARRPVSLVGALLLVAALLPASATPVAASGATVPAGFADETVWSGLDHPMAIAFAADGQVFVAEKRGTIQRFDSLSDTTPTLFADLNVNVHNWWDRGMMGLAVDPGYTSGRPYVYVLYAYNHVLGSGSAAPRWPSDAGDPYADRCPTPPGSTDGCVVSGRLSRLTSDGNVMTGGENVLIEDWCQQFSSHSLGSLIFGSEGALYISAGEGASFQSGSPDYGQFGGTNGPTTPVNPCDDPPGGIGGSMTPPTAEGGVLRSQDIRTLGDPTGLGGTILRVDPDTGAAWPTNANIGMSDANARKIIGYGLRNPFRFTIRPGTDDVWVGDVGFNTWEEINYLPDPTAAARNFGWPCYEGAGIHAFVDNLALDLCESLSAGSVTAPFFTYNHTQSIQSGDGCGTGSSSIAGLAFLPSSSGYPSSYDNGLFFTDYTRNCIWFMPDSSGTPNVAGRVRFANLARPDPETDGGAVFLTIAPTGDLIYADYDRGEVRRIHYYGGNVPPVASFTATPSNGAAPLNVSFNASGSSDADGDALTYAWDLDADGAYDDATGVSTSRTYSSVGDVDVGLRVTDTSGATGTTTRTVSVGNSPPTVSITAPLASLTWQVGQNISFTATGTDPQDGTLPASAFEWTLTMEHCPSDCHSHIITSFTDVKSGSFDAPDHEYPSHLKLAVTVTDSMGLTASKEVEIFPKTGTVSATSVPAGIPLTVSATTAIVGSTISVSAPLSAVLGEETWTFDSWSDGGARTHGVPVVQGATSLTATYDRTSTTDRSDTCSASPAAVKPSNQWISGTFAKTNDADWYRFTMSSAGKIRLVLGDLTTGGRMDLYSGCTTLLQSSDRGGNGAEEIIRSLAAGSYAVKLSGSGTGATPPYVVRMRVLPASVHILSTKTRIEGGTLRLIGELYNNTTKTVGSTKVTAKLYNASNVLLATRTAYADLSYMVPNSKAPFRIVGTLPAGYHHAAYTISATPTTRLVGAPSVTTTTNGLNGSDQYVVAGTAKNPYSKTITTLWVAVSLYDGRANILDAARAKVGTTTLGALKSTTFSATFIPLGLTPDKTYIRGMVFR